MTPFDVVKTRLQTQPPQPQVLFPRPPLNTCCQPTKAAAASCVRNMSSIARSLPTEVVCVWDRGLLRTERVNGFLDAVRHVWRVEGFRGLWKGAGTSLFVSHILSRERVTDLPSESLEFPHPLLISWLMIIYSMSPFHPFYPMAH